MIKRVCMIYTIISIVLCIAVGCSGTIDTVNGKSKNEINTTSETIIVSEESESAIVYNSEINIVVELPSETTVTSDAEIAEVIRQEPEEVPKKNITWTAPNGEVIGAEFDVNSDYVTFEKAVCRLSLGIDFDSEKNPEMFDKNTHEFLGEAIKFSAADFIVVKSGDIINGYTIEKAELGYDIDVGRFNWNSILFKDYVVLTGEIEYCNFDDPTTISKGDILFYPDSSYKGMPVMYNYVSEGSKESYSCSEIDEDSDYWYKYSDTVVIRLGNLFTNYADSEEINSILKDGTEHLKFNAEVVIDNLLIAESDFMGSTWTNGVIISIKINE